MTGPLPRAVGEAREPATRPIRRLVDAATDRVRTGDLGAAPVVAGLVLIWIVFGALNPVFLSPTNLVNLAMQSAAVGVMAIGIVLLLLIGEIDLSVGSVSGLAGAILAVGFVQLGWPLPVVILLAIASGSVVGLVYGVLYTRFGIPGFVLTLAGLLAVLGVQLRVLGSAGSINLPLDSWIVQFGQQMFVPQPVMFAIDAAVVALLAWRLTSESRRRSDAGLAAMSRFGIVVRVAALALLLGITTWYLGLGRGVGAMVLFFVLLVAATHLALSRTRWGRAVYAVGGSAEAARRAGIRVTRIRVSVFIACSTFAAVGGVLAAARLAGANQSSGGSDTYLNAIAAAVIGGTSLFGGRGSAFSALLGILVISSISLGLTLLSLDSSVRYLITGGVLVLAVIIDSLTRSSRKAAGRA